MIKKSMKLNETKSNNLITPEIIYDLDKYLRDKKLFIHDMYTDGTHIFGDIVWGDWKHDHLRANYLVTEYFKDKGFDIANHDYIVTEEDGSDNYSASHRWTIRESESKALDESYDFTDITKLDDIMSNLIDNLSDKDLDEDLRLFSKIAKELGVKDYKDLYVLTTDENEYDLTWYKDSIEFIKDLYKSRSNIKVYKYNDRTYVFERHPNGNYFIYAESEKDLDDIMDFVESQYDFDDLEPDDVALNESTDNDDIELEIIKIINDVRKDKGETDSSESIEEIEKRLKDRGISVDADHLGELIVKLQETIDPKDVDFNDRYFPRIDVNGSQYEFYRYKDKDFAYDKDHYTLIYLFKDEDEARELGDSAPYRELDAIGFNRDYWNNKETRDEYLDKYIYDLDSETSALLNDFVKYELPHYKKESVVENVLDVKSLNNTHFKYTANFNLNCNIDDYNSSSEDVAKENSNDAILNAIKDLTNTVKTAIDKKLNKDNTYVDLNDNDIDLDGGLISAIIYIDKDISNDDAISAISDCNNLTGTGTSTFEDIDFNSYKTVGGWNVPDSYSGWKEYADVESDVTVEIIIKSINDIKYES